MVKRISILTLVLGLHLHAHAQDPQSEASTSDAEARAAFAAGSSAFGEGAFQGALRRFERSYELSGQPDLLYNIGQCHDRLRNDSQAITSFEAFIEARPNSGERTAVEQRLSILRERVAQHEAQAQQLEDAERRAMDSERQRLAQQTLAAQPTSDEERTPLVRQWWLWTIVGVVVVGATVGVVAATRDPGVESPILGDGGVVYQALQVSP